jgi:tetratricopeptide (TPR) repeat protein
MDGRWKLVVAGGILAGAVGCNSTQKRPGDTVAQTPTPTPAQVAAAKSSPPPTDPPRTNLKPSTYVSMGALTEQAANEKDRTQAERDSFRQQARQAYQKAIQVDPKYAPAYVALGESYMGTHEREQAQAMFKKATEVAPTDALLWSELGAAQARCKEWPAAIASLTKAVQLDPGNKPLETRLGLTLARAGKYEDALNVLVKIMPEAEARYNIARMMRHNQQTDAANIQLQLALKADPECKAARELLDEQGVFADYGFRQAGYQQQAPPQPAIAPAAPNPPASAVAAPRLPPVQLGSGVAVPVEPTPVGVTGNGQ